jgi:hypothetical protein
MNTQAQAPSGRKPFHGTLVRVVWRDGKVSTVSYPAVQHAQALRFAGSTERLNKVVRDIASKMARPAARTGSALVREKALARLRGMYRPGREFESLGRLPEAELAALDAALAAENNSAWECVQ